MPRGRRSAGSGAQRADPGCLIAFAIGCTAWSASVDAAQDLRELKCLGIGGIPEACRAWRHGDLASKDWKSWPLQCVQRRRRADLLWQLPKVLPHWEVLDQVLHQEQAAVRAASGEWGCGLVLSQVQTGRWQKNEGARWEEKQSGGQGSCDIRAKEEARGGESATKARVWAEERWEKTRKRAGRSREAASPPREAWRASESSWSKGKAPERGTWWEREIAPKWESAKRGQACAREAAQTAKTGRREGSTTWKTGSRT